jgi:hypothetical protein
VFYPQKKNVTYGSAARRQQIINDNVVINLLLRLSLFYIWENKLKKNYLSIASYVTFLAENVRVMAKINKSLSICMSNASLLICRQWHGEQL